MDPANETDWTRLDMPNMIQEMNETDFNITMLGPQRDSLYIVIPITIIYAIIFFTGVLGNVSTCIVIARNKSMHTATNYYLFSLAVSDLLLLVTGLPQEMYSIWSRYPYVFGEVFCVLRGLASETSANATVLTITAFTVERYVAICHPFLSHTMSKLSRAVKLILAVWVIAFSFAVPQALQFGIVHTGTVVCMVNKVIIQHSFELSTFLFFVAPMTLITVLYALIGLQLRTSNMMKKSAGNSGGDTSRRSCRHQHGQSSRRVLKMLVAVVVAFFICWAPFHAQRLVAIYETSFKAAPPYKLKLYEIITYVSGVLYYVSTTVNPILYHIMSNKFREAFKETFSRCCWCGGSVRGSQGTRLSDRRSCYSILSRSGGGTATMRASCGTGSRSGIVHKHAAPESTDSGTYSHRHSEESMCLHPAGVMVMHGTTVQKQKQALFIPNDNQAENMIAYTGNNKDLNAVVAQNKLNEQTIESSQRKRLTRYERFQRIFRCIAQKTLDDKKLADTTESHTHEPYETHTECNTTRNESIHLSLYNESNCNLRDIEHDVLEDELTIYMKEIQRREKDNS